jgi:hypothetical protein
MWRREVCAYTCGAVRAIHDMQDDPFGGGEDGRRKGPGAGGGGRRGGDRRAMCLFVSAHPPVLPRRLQRRSLAPNPTLPKCGVARFRIWVRCAVVPYLEVVQLIRDLLARLAHEELLALQHGRVELLEADGGAHGHELAEQPAAEAHVLWEEVTRAWGERGWSPVAGLGWWRWGLGGEGELDCGKRVVTAAGSGSAAGGEKRKWPASTRCCCLVCSLAA